MTQSKIAEQLGISQMHVSRLLHRICSRLQEEIENGETPPGGPDEPDGPDDRGDPA